MVKLQEQIVENSAFWFNQSRVLFDNNIFSNILQNSNNEKSRYLIYHEQCLAGITFIRNFHSKKIGKLNNLKVYGIKYNKGPKQDSQTCLRLPMSSE